MVQLQLDLVSHFKCKSFEKVSSHIFNLNTVPFPRGAFITFIERFQSPGLHPCYFIWTNESIYMRKEFHSHRIDHFPVPPGLCIKTKLSALPLIWKWLYILMQLKLIFPKKVVNLASFWKWGFLKLGIGLLSWYTTWAAVTSWLLVYFLTTATRSCNN